MAKIYRKLDDSTLEQVNVIKKEDLLERLKVIESQIEEQVKSAKVKIREQYIQEIQRISTRTSSPRTKESLETSSKRS